VIKSVVESVMKFGINSWFESGVKSGIKSGIQSIIKSWFESGGESGLKSEFKQRRKSMNRCIVYGCTNHKNQGSFEGDICTPCYRMITSGKINPSDNWFVQKIQKLEKGLEIYDRERKRFLHNYPEMTGAFFLAGGMGESDDNLLPRYVEICPAYGCGWTQIYERTERTISSEGS
jgi:hypothetical protein